MGAPSSRTEASGRFASGFSTSRRPQSILRTQRSGRGNASLSAGRGKSGEDPSAGRLQKDETRGISWNDSAKTYQIRQDSTEVKEEVFVMSDEAEQNDADESVVDVSGRKDYFEDVEKDVDASNESKKPIRRESMAAHLLRSLGLFGTLDEDNPRAGADGNAATNKRRSLLNRRDPAGKRGSIFNVAGLLRSKPGSNTSGEDSDESEGGEMEGRQTWDGASPTPRKRGSLVGLVHSLKPKHRAKKKNADVDERDGAANRPKSERSLRSRRRHRHNASTREEATRSIDVFDRVASEKYNKRGSLLAEKAERRNRSDSSMKYAARGSKGSGRAKVDIKMGGEPGYNEKIASILYPSASANERSTIG